MRFLPVRPVCLVVALLGLISGVFGQGAPRDGAWAHESSELKPDPRVVWGKLDNGFRYALLPHRGVLKSASVQLVVLSGSLDETEEERGLAHFIEHMCFRGTRSFTESEMIRFFQELGTEYGSDVNAITTFDHTAYTLDFRDASSELLGKGLRLFRSFADEVTFSRDKIEHERGVILSELRSRDGVMAKGQLASMQTMFEGLMFPLRSPGGFTDNIKRFTAAQFEAFYRRCYRPDLMVLVAAGDFDAGELATMVEDQFGSLVRPNAPVPERNLGRLVESKGLRTGSFSVSDVGYVRATVASVQSMAGVPDSRAERIERDRENMAQALLSERLGHELLDTPGGEAATEVTLGYRAAIAAVMTNGEGWRENLTALDQMIRTTLKWGFEQREIDSLRDRRLRITEILLDQFPHADPNQVAQELVDSIVDHEVYVGAEQEYRWVADDLRTMTADELAQTFRRLWDPAKMVVHLGGELPEDFKESAVVEAVLKDRKNPLREVKPGERKEYFFELKPWGDPGTAELVRDLPEVGAKLFKLSNEVRLNFVHSTAEPGIVRTEVRVGSGLIDMPGNKPALKEFGLQTLFASGTTYYRAEDLSKIIDDRFLSFGLDVDDYDAFTFRGTTNRAELPSFLGVVTEYLFQPKFGTYVHQSEKLRAAIGRATSTMGMQQGMRELTDYLFDGDARFTWGNYVDYLGLSSIDVKHWLDKPLREGYVEVTIVGDIDEAKMLEEVCRTLGALGTRAAVKKTAAQPKPVKVTAPGGFKRIEFVGEVHLAVVMGVWPVTEALDSRDRVVLYLLSKILELHVREEIRNNLGLAYGPMAEFEEFYGFPEFALLRSVIDCQESDTSKIARLVEDIAVKLSKEGIDEGEFVGARGILSSRYRRASLENGFLLNSLVRAQERPESVDELLSIKAGLVDEITLAEVNAWAKKILTRRNTRTAAIVPKQFVGIFQTK